MKPIEIEELLEKFYNGETTLNEEQLLKEYFEQETIPEQFSEVKEYFMFVQKEKEMTLDGLFDQKLFAAMNEAPSERNSRKVWVYRLSGIAATVMVLVWLGVEIFQPKQVYGTVTDPALAFNETRNALNLIASELNISLKPAERTVQTLDKSLRKVYMIEKWHATFEKTEKMFRIGQNITKENS